MKSENPKYLNVIPILITFVFINPSYVFLFIFQDGNGQTALHSLCSSRGEINRTHLLKKKLESA